MRSRLHVTGLSIAAVLAAAWLASDRISAQAPAKPQTPAAAPARPAPAAAKAAPRTPDGHPDFQGTYDVATITPVERPAGITNLALTEKEAQAMEMYEAQRQVKNDAPLDPNRAAPPVGGQNAPPKSYLEFLEAAGGGAVGGYNNFWLAGGSTAIMLDGVKRSSILIDPPDGHMPPMKPEARRRNQAYLARAAAPSASESEAAGPPGAFDNPESRPLSERCLLGFLSTSGPPTQPNYFYNNLKKIVQTPTTIMFLNEMVHDARIVRMNAEHLPPTIRKWMGDSVGKWEGDTLVIDTTNFTEKTQYNGSSDQLHVVERISRMDDKTLRYRFTVEDPTTWDKPFTGEYPWRATNDMLYEYACHEGNYSLAGMLRGARQQEADAAAKKKN